MARSEGPAASSLDDELGDLFWDGVIVFDLETQNLFSDVGARDPSKLRLAVAVTWDAENGFREWLEPQVSKLVEELARFRIIVGYNVLDFDYEVLSAYHPQARELLAPKTVDLMQHLKAVLGYRVSLDNLALATLGEGKTGKGRDAPALFHQGKLLELISYCRKDVELTARLYRFGASQGMVLLSGGAGAVNRVAATWASVHPNSGRDSGTNVRFCRACGAKTLEKARFCQACGRALGLSYGDSVLQSQGIMPPQPEVTALERLEPAGFWLRFAAYVVDSVMLYIAGLVLGFVLTLLFFPESLPIVLATLLSLALGLSYYALFESSEWQATPGKKALNLKVVDLNGRRISVGRGYGRAIAKILSGIPTLFIGMLMIVWTQRKQALHDFISGTLVVKDRSSWRG